VPQAASPCPFAIGCASGECRAAWLAGVLTWQAGQTVSSIKFNHTRSSVEFAFLKELNYYKKL
jgi:hypothetical protein